jgi:hypothetical protein
MSANKFKYYVVETTTTVKANNMTDARALANGRRGVSGTVVEQYNNVKRVSAQAVAEATV